jgi:hypothetical protein
MKRFFGAMLATVVVCGTAGTALADDQDVKAVLDKAIKALGGEEKLSAAKALTWKSKGTINIGGNDNDFTTEVTAQGLDHYRQAFEGKFGDDKVKGAVVLAGDKGWRQFADNKMELTGDALTNEKRSVYLQLTPVTLVALKEKPFKVEPTSEDQVAGKPAVGIKVTGPDNKDFRLYFDKENGLPVKLVAKVVGFMGEEVDQETTYADYKEFQGIKKATKVQSKRNGDKFLEQQISDFKVLDKVDAKTFTEPQ